MATIENGVMNIDKISVIVGDDAYWRAFESASSDSKWGNKYIHSVPSGSLGYNSTTKELISGVGFVESNSVLTNIGGVDGLYHTPGSLNAPISSSAIPIVGLGVNTEGAMIDARAGKNLNERLVVIEESFVDFSSITEIVCGE